MKRTDITELFPEATDEQVKTLMDLNGADINAAKKTVTDLQGQLTAAQAEVQKLQAGGASEDLQKTIAALQTELNGMKQAESLRLMREKVAGEKNVPAGLLTGETEEACAQQADAILTFAKAQGYPKLPDSGDPQLTPPAPSASDKFAEWINEMRK